MFPNIQRFSTRILGVVAILIGSQVAAQQPTTPFFPEGFGGNPQKMMERMFGASTPEEDLALAKIDIPFKDERQFGQQCVNAYLEALAKQKLKVTQKGPDVEYLRQLVETLHPYMKNAKRYKKFTIHVVDSPNVDARAFAGGALFFFKGLLKFADNEAALIGIVGHELSHLDRGHLLLPLKRVKFMQEGPNFAAGGQGFDPQKFFSGGMTMMRLMGRPFRPEDEAAADRDGAAWSYQAGYDPRELAGLFAKLHVKNQDQKVPFGDFFRTHPYNEDRVEAIMTQYVELQQKDPKANLYRGKKNLLKRIAKSQQEFPE